MELDKLTEGQLIKYIEHKISNYSLIQQDMKIGKEYYNYNQDIDTKQRMMIGEKGALVPIHNLPNQKYKDNQYARAVDQKINYLFSQKPNIDTENEETIKFLNDFIDNRFMRTLNKIAIDSYNCGLAWLYLSTDGDEIKYKKMEPESIIPIWEDDNHESLNGVIRILTQELFEGETLVTKTYVYLYTPTIVKKYDYNSGHLEFIEDEAYLSKEKKKKSKFGFSKTINKNYNYGRIPFVYFKQPGELPLILKVKDLQDGLNLLMSNFADGMLENPRNTILIIKNYDGQDLGEFRRNLAETGAVKVKSTQGAEGGLESLEINVDSENYKVIIEMLKKAIAQNARSLYLDNDRTTQAPNTLNIKSMYSDMELDANAMELEFTASFEYLFKFINQVKKIDFDGVDIKFKRNIMVNDESIVTMIKDSVGIVSNETLRAKHPLVEDAEKEEKRIKKEESERLKYLDDYQGFGDGNGRLLE